MRTRFLCLFFLVASALSAQFASPISWSFDHRAMGDDQFELIATATAESGWAIYSQFTEDGGPVPTTFYWNEGDHYERIGEVTEKGHKKEGMDELFGVNVSKFLSDEPVVFTQTVKVTDYSQPIELEVEYMCCDDEQCLPPTTEAHSYVLSPAGPGRGAKPDKEGPKLTAKGVAKDIAAEGTKPETSKPATPPSEDDKKLYSKQLHLPGAEKVPYEEVGMVVKEEMLPQEEVLRTVTTSLAPPSEEAPVSWTFRAEELNGDRYRITMIGEILPGWYTYSSTVDPEIGPIPTEVFFEPTDAYRTIGEVTETAANLKTKYDKTWAAEVSVINGGRVTYSQVVELRGATKVSGFLVFQTCDDEQCLPPKDLPFSLAVNDGRMAATLDGVTSDEVSGNLAAGDGSAAESDNTIVSVNFDPEPVGACSVGAASTKGQNLLGIFGLGLLGGLFALIMPCIFPMIPITVSFFTKSSGSRTAGIQRAGLYGFFIFLIYVLLSLPFHLLDGLDPGILNTIASNVWLNIVFFLVFLFFAGSFFGFYELTLPSSWGNRASRAEGTGGVAGIFFMALTLALVSFSCTGPILGSLLVEAVSGGAWPLTAGMAGFGVALGLPFALFAAFPGVLNNLPKSGGWLNSVKVVLGFVEVALAFKFLSNADLIGDWDLLRIEPFLAVWMLCALGIAAYLLGWISFPNDSGKRRTGPVGWAVALAGIAFTAYLAFGFTKDNDTGNYQTLNLLSGIAPPVCYSYFSPCDCPQNITCFKDLEAGLAHAREVNKPVMIDFTGYTCVNCRKMEENVWSEDRIKDLLTDEYVLISLYVDDRKELPESEHQEVTRLDGSGRTLNIDQVGEKWHYFQQSVFARASQPYYVLVSPEGQTLNPPVAYTPDVEDYENFLRCGLSTFKGMQGK